MKPLLLLSLALLFCYLPANAQISFGIKGSYTKAWFSTDQEAKMDGLGTTVSLYKRLNRYLEIGIEPGVVQRGTNQMFGHGNYFPFIICCIGPCPLIPNMPGTNNALKANYVQAPLLVRARVPLGTSPLTAFAKLGGGPSYLASGNYETTNMDDTTFEIKPVIAELGFSDEYSFKRWDWGLYGGIGVGLQMGTGQLVLETELYRGLSNTVAYADYKHRTLSYSLGYMIHLN